MLKRLSKTDALGQAEDKGGGPGAEWVENKPVMSIIIVGCGKVGRTITERLSAEGHNITVVDLDKSVIDEVCDAFDVMGITGNGGSVHVLEEAGFQGADMFIAVTGSDELNLLCCTLAKKGSRSVSTIARVRNPDYSNELGYLREQLGLFRIINPEQEAARQIARILVHPQALTVRSFARGDAEMIRFKVPEGNRLCGKSLKDLGEIFRFNFLVCAVERTGDVCIPNGSYVLEAGDDITVIASAQDVQRIFSSIDMRGGAVKSCMIVGGGRSGYYLAKELTGQNVDVKLLEADRARCDEICDLLPKVNVICADGGNEAVLREEGIASVEAFVPMTRIDEENILLTLFARRIPGLKTITQINRITFNDVIDELEMGSVIYPKYVAAEEIIKYVRAKRNGMGSNVESVYHLFDNRVEIAEFLIEEDGPVTGIQLMHLKRKDNLLIACIDRGGTIIFPRGQDTIQPGDSVIIVTTHTGLGNISDILA